MARWELSKVPDERERIWVSVNLMEQIKSALVNYAVNGSLSKRQLDELATGHTKRFGVI